MDTLELDTKARRELQRFILDEVEAVIFSTRRPKKKIKGGNYIEDDTGALRKSIKANRNFITVDKKGNISIDIKVVDYFKYLDDERRRELNWYLSEAIFESQVIRDKVRELQAQSSKRTILKMIKKAFKR